MFDPYTNKASILIVDDEPNNLKVLHNLLTENGYDVRAARDGETALAAVRTTHPDLILLDIKMPNMSGYEVCESLKRDDEVADIPVIFISALNHVKDIVKAFQVGGVDYVTKPFQFEEVLARVNNHLTIVHQQNLLLQQREQIEAMHKRDQARFKKISHMREQFIQAATHDLKNPLAIVLGCADIMGRFDEVRAHPHLRECVDNVQHASKEMMNLITSMLDLVKMQSTLSLDLQPTNLAQLVSQSIRGSKILANERNIHIKETTSQASIIVDVDARMLQRVFDNLMSNAIKYSPDNTTVEVIVIADDDKAVVHVVDEGFGISEEHLPHVFDPFFRAKKYDGEREIDGTGLGLSVVKELVEQHGGTVNLTSSLGEGTTFSVYLRMNS